MMEAILHAIRALPGQRSLIGIAGPPASGKSTIAAKIAATLSAQGAPTAILGMDGFHYDDRVLDQLGRKSRKGAPDTFDVAGLAAMLDRLRHPTDIAVPVFDRSIEIARAGAEIIPAATRHIVVEGNYLLLNDAPWGTLSFDLTVMVTVPEDVLRSRLMARWAHLPHDEATRKTEENDLPNGQRVLANSRAASLTITN